MNPRRIRQAQRQKEIFDRLQEQYRARVMIIFISGMIAGAALWHLVAAPY